MKSLRAHKEPRRCVLNHAHASERKVVLLLLQNVVVAFHSTRARAVRSNSHASTSQWVMLTGGPDVLWRTFNLGGAQCTKPLKYGIPGYPTPTHHLKRNSPPPSSSSSRLPPPSPTITPRFLLLHLLLFAALSSQLGSAADRSPGFSLLGQNGGGGLSVNERSRDCMTGSDCAPKFQS